MTSFYWNIDIEEQGTGHSFTAGPIVFEPTSGDGESLTVSQLIARVQQAFDDAFDEDRAPQQYEIDARIVPVSNAAQIDASSPDTAILAAAMAHSELDISYRITNSDGTPFTIRFTSNTTLPVTDLPSAEITVVNNRDIVSFETDYCSIESTITDLPPTPPEITFVPYKGVNNKVLIMLNSNSGEKLEKPIVLQDNDLGFIQTEYASQHGITVDTETSLSDPNTPPKEYKNDDPIKAYELFRVNTKPELVGSSLYPNFRGKSLTEAPLQSIVGPDKSSTAAHFVDTIIPNKKYWYCARSMDVHQNISNPTYIFEVEMIDNHGQMYLTTKPFSITTATPPYQKSGRKYMAIRPRLSQTVYDPNSIQANDIGAIAIGSEPGGTSAILGQSGVDSVWEKQFKIRVISKKTGRKIDLNLRFKNTGVITP